ncbi:M99 family carboxypeptidase catalytic domain-containing protein [uncultured Helicobacter sp.]|uniref:M99 family carboxypeptidase catalytic domain-containing protein n=1 Tax=uncultured Helicobacter sp. TaxID=175537 RepID=UPI0026119E73|nr:M99 family carboxypeptidase catalytic domain-containing protein [uncultured Helicobacter sp.]
MRFFLIFISLIVTFCTLNAENLVRDFALYKLNENDKRAPTLLLMGGIHGDEPGAYYSTDIFMRHYKITKGSVWVVPVVNPHGMFANMRGVYGDMNRKFAALATNDPDYQSIQKIKQLLAEKDIDISLHLHDGSGYWRPQYISNLLNPARWGNCSVIDQPELNGAKYGDLESFVAQMVADINLHILNPLHRYHVHNTHTKAKNNTEQLKALTFFSLSLGKPALTNEASKELDIPTRVYYHLLAIESLLGQLGIGFERDFELNVASVKELLSPALLQIKIEEHITLPLDSLRPFLTHFPLPKNTAPKHIKTQSDSHLLGLVRNTQGNIELKYGSRTISTLIPQYHTFDASLQHIRIKIDEQWQSVPIGSIVYAKDSIEFEPLEDYRINVIGYVKPNDNSPMPDEVGIRIYKKDFIPRYSIDTQALSYRAEIYHKKDILSGIVIISFKNPPKPQSSTYQAIAYTPAPLRESKNIDTAQAASLPPTKPTQKHIKDNKKPRPKNTDEPKPSPQPTELQKIWVASPRGVNVRTKPTTQSPIIAKLPQGTTLQVLESQGKWSKITNNAHIKEGYIISSALTDKIETKITDAVPLPKSPSPIDKKPLDLTIDKSSLKKAESGSPNNAKIIVNIALIRTNPSRNAPVIAKAPLGREMQILSFEGENDEWAKIRYIFGSREINGYVAKRLLKPL